MVLLHFELNQALARLVLFTPAPEHAPSMQLSTRQSSLGLARAGDVGRDGGKD